MPVKNTEAYLEECLDAQLEQDFEDWELIAVNDGSEDGSAAILEAYARRDGRIKWVDNSGQGIIAALRCGYALSAGELISRMDSDDVSASNKIGHMYAQLREAGKGHLATGQVKYFCASEKGLGEGYLAYEQWLNALTSRGHNFAEIYKECVIPSPSWMLYREDFDALGGFSPDRYPEDYDLCFRFYEYGLKVIPSDQVLHHWRDYSTRTSRTDAHYADNSFLALKVDYFLKLHRDNPQKLVVWGAGKRGKRMARLLLERSIDFEWICNNPQKIGHNIYGKIMHSVEALEEMRPCQVLVTVAVKEAQERIRLTMKAKGMLRGRDFFEFC